MTNISPAESRSKSKLPADAPTKLIKIWDIPVRVFHWSLVSLFVAAYITNALGTKYFTYHVWSGYAIIVLVSFRVIWGVVGTYHARFINFVKNPIATLKYTVSVFKKTDTHYLGHNPLGAVMVVVLLMIILVQAITGLFTNDEIFYTGPLYGYISDELSLKLTSLHRHLFYWILGAVVLHVLAVVFHVIFKRDNIIKAMFTGKKSADSSRLEIPIGSSRIWLALIIVIALACGLAWVIVHAPIAVSSE